jgi:ABC-type transport system involved in Fe-S cluster assembly fused permease/ATPase subunit
MGAQDDAKRVWFETASFWSLLRYFFKFANICIWLIGMPIGITLTLIGVYTPLYYNLFMLVVWFHAAYPVTILIYGIFILIVIAIKTVERRNKKRNLKHSSKKPSSSQSPSP